MSNIQEETSKFELLLTLEGNIVCQRFFPVKGLNKKSLNSLDVYSYMSVITDEISAKLKRDNFLFLTEKSRQYDESKEEEVSKPEHFSLILKHENRTILTRVFDAHTYHPRVRYSVDIRPKTKTYTNTLATILSSTDVETKYLNQKLGR